MLSEAGEPYPFRSDPDLSILWVLSLFSELTPTPLPPLLPHSLALASEATVASRAVQQLTQRPAFVRRNYKPGDCVELCPDLWDIASQLGRRLGSRRSPGKQAPYTAQHALGCSR